MARIRHLAILTEDVERLVHFYSTAFELKVVEGVGTATYLSDGHINLAIIPIGPEREVEGRHLQPGFNHFGFEVDDNEAVVKRFEEKGYRPPRKRPGDRLYAEFRAIDPDGNNFDISASGYESFRPDRDMTKKVRRETV